MQIIREFKSNHQRGFFFFEENDNGLKGIEVKCKEIEGCVFSIVLQSELNFFVLLFFTFLLQSFHNCFEFFTQKIGISYGETHWPEREVCKP